MTDACLLGCPEMFEHTFMDALCAFCCETIVERRGFFEVVSQGDICSAIAL